MMTTAQHEAFAGSTSLVFFDEMFRIGRSGRQRILITVKCACQRKNAVGANFVDYHNCFALGRLQRAHREPSCRPTSGGTRVIPYARGPIPWQLATSASPATLPAPPIASLAESSASGKAALTGWTRRLAWSRETLRRPAVLLEQPD